MRAEAGRDKGPIPLSKRLLSAKGGADAMEHLDEANRPAAEKERAARFSNR
jgi:hypothetical protein